MVALPTLLELGGEPLKPWMRTEIIKRRFYASIEELGIALLVCLFQPSQSVISIVILFL